jgi:hypothetical protein
VDCCCGRAIVEFNKLFVLLGFMIEFVLAKFIRLDLNKNKDFHILVKCFLLSFQIKY